MKPKALNEFKATLQRLAATETDAAYLEVVEYFLVQVNEEIEFIELKNSSFENNEEEKQMNNKSKRYELHELQGAGFLVWDNNIQAPIPGMYCMSEADARRITDTFNAQEETKRQRAAMLAGNNVKGAA